MVLSADTGTAIKPWVMTAPEPEIGGLAPGLELHDDLSHWARIAELGRDAVTPGIPELARRQLRLSTLAGYNPMIPWRFLLYASHASGYSPVAHSISEAVPILYERPKLFDLMGVTDFLREPADDGRWRRSTTALPPAYLVPGQTVVPQGRGDDLMRLEMNALRVLQEIDPRRQVLLHGALVAPALERQPRPHPAGPSSPSGRFPSLPAARIESPLRSRPIGLAVWCWASPSSPAGEPGMEPRKCPCCAQTYCSGLSRSHPASTSILSEFTPVSWRLGWWVSVVAVFVTAGSAVYGVGARKS